MKMACVWILLLALLASGIAESSAGRNVLEDDELPEGVYIYSPAERKFLPYNEVDGRKVYQVIGLAPGDSTVSVKVSLGKQTIWQEDTISEGNGYFYAEIPADKLDIEPEYVLDVQSGIYSDSVAFWVYNGTISEYALDPLHLALLEDLQPDELNLYEEEMKKEASGDSDDTGTGDQAELVETGPNEFRNAEYSYIVGEDGTATLTYYYKHTENLKLPEVVDGFTVSGISFELFNTASGVRTVTIPNGITKCPMSPFYAWNSLTAIYVPQDHPTLASVNGVLYSKDLSTLIAYPSKHPEKEAELPNGTRKTGDAAFFKSTIRKAVLPDTFRELGADTFAYARYMRRITLTDNLRILQNGCLRDTGLLSLMIPSNATANGCFTSNCTSMTEITVMPGNETMQSIDGVLFSADGETLISYPAGKEGKNYTTPKDTVIIGAKAFVGTVNLERVTLSNSVEEIEEDGFRYSSIKSVTIPNSLTRLPENVFMGCEKLSEFIVQSNHPTLSAVKRKYLYSKDHTIFYCYPLGVKESSYVLEKETEEISGYAFAMAELKNVVLPEGLKRIGHQAFYGSSLNSIYVPGTVKEIEIQAFSYSKIQYAALGTGVEILGGSVFNASTGLGGVSVPDTVKSIGSLCFLNTPLARIYTKEGSFMHQYAVQNQLMVDVDEGDYEKFTESIRTNRDPLRALGYVTVQTIRITSNDKVNIRKEPSLDSRRLGMAEKGEEYDVIDIIYEGDRAAWYKIEMEDGTEGYINGKSAELL